MPDVGPQEAFRALSDPTRRSILMMLGDRDMSIGEVASNFDVTRGAIKKHLSILEEGRLISVRTVGRERINRLEAATIREVNDWLGYFDQFWDRRLSNLKYAIEKGKD